jgi:hypothetical protein
MLPSARFADPHGVPDVMAGSCAFMASDASATLTAQTLIVDGGMP